MRIVQIAQNDLINQVSNRLPIKLSKEQETAILSEIAKFQERPTPEEYSKVQKRLLNIPIPIPVNKRKPIIAIQNVVKGYEPGEVKLMPNFNPKQDLPEGWGLYSMYDSGGNHRVGNAAEIVWRSIWNNWYYYINEEPWSVIEAQNDTTKIRMSQNLQFVKTPEEFNERETSRAIRDAIINEQLAIQQYEAIVDAVSDDKVKKVLQEIADEERVHVGELLALLNLSSEEEAKFLDDGAKEVSQD